VQPLVGVAADREGNDHADPDADGDAFEQRTAAIGIFGHLWHPGGGQAGLNARADLLLDLLQERRHRGVTVFGS
jgi:hypothetical protein